MKRLSLILIPSIISTLLASTSSSALNFIDTEGQPVVFRNGNSITLAIIGDAAESY